MTRPLITAAREWTDGFSRLVVTRDLDGRVCYGVHDIRTPGFVASFNQAVVEEIVAFSKGEE